MVSTDIVKIRRVLINEKGYVSGELLPDFAGTIEECYEHYSHKWMQEYCDKNGTILPSITDEIFETREEFTVKSDDYFYIGLFNTLGYEAITLQFEGYPGMELDEYGFERMKNNDGMIVPYTRRS